MGSGMGGGMGGSYIMQGIGLDVGQSIPCLHLSHCKVRISGANQVCTLV